MGMRCLKCGHIEDTESSPDLGSQGEDLPASSSSSSSSSSLVRKCPSCRGPMSPILICHLVPASFSAPKVAPPKPRPLADYLYVDGHMGDYPAPSERAELCKGATIKAAPGDYFGASKGSLARIHYVFGNWNVLVPWPFVWLARGEKYIPAPNRYGFAPSAEFGVPSFVGETVLRTDLGRVAPFAYPTLGAGTYTPELDFIHGEAITPVKFSQFSKAVTGGMSAAEAVAKHLGRK